MMGNLLNLVDILMCSCYYRKWPCEVKKNEYVSKILMVHELMKEVIVKRQQGIDNQIYIARENRLVDKDFFK